VHCEGVSLKSHLIRGDIKMYSLHGKGNNPSPSRKMENTNFDITSHLLLLTFVYVILLVVIVLGAN
jgi:hypothetical protein